MQTLTIPSFFTALFSPNPGPFQAQVVQLRQPVVIPYAAPYMDKGREITRLFIPYFISVALGEEGAVKPLAALKDNLRWTFELLINGSPVYLQEIEVPTSLYTVEKPEEQLPNYTKWWQGEIATDFVNPITILAGQSLEWRFSILYDPTPEMISKVTSFNSQLDVGYQFGANAKPVPARAFLVYNELWTHPRGRDR